MQLTSSSVSTGRVARTAAAVAEEDRCKGPVLRGRRPLVHVQNEPPRRARLVVVVAVDHRHGEPSELDVARVTCFHAPGQGSVANAVRRASSAPSADHAAGADRVAVARLEIGSRHPPRVVDARHRSHYVRVYSGPLPPSGGVRRPPFAVIAPHCTQFDGVTVTPSSVASYTCAGHIRSHMSARSGGTSRRRTMWFGWSSRVLLPEAKTDESLSKVSLPSGAG